MAAALPIAVPNGPDTKHGYTFVYLNIPLLVLSAVIVGFRVWWRCIRNSGGTLNKADICVIISLVITLLRGLSFLNANYLTDIQYYSSGLYIIR